MDIINVIIYIMLLSIFNTAVDSEDIPCAARLIPGKSVVCVCNVTYCDTITRLQPQPHTYVAYTSSEGGSRFKKTTGKLQSSLKNTESCPSPTFTLNPEVKYQKVEGFGSSVTDSAGIMWKSIPVPLQKHLIESYFGDHGLEYNMLRVPIGGTDFSPRLYAYNEYPPHDATLSNYTLAIEDYKYKIPMIRAIKRTSPQPVHIIASTWSPPPWMKNNNAFYGNSRLLPEYYQTYADYHLKFLEKYAAEGIHIWGITTGNEPTDSVAVEIITLNSLGWNADSMATWIIHNLGPTIRRSPFKDTMIMCVDDQRPFLPYWATLMLKHHPKALEYIDGIAVHFYRDNVVPATELSQIAEQFPDKFIINTEAAIDMLSGVPVDLGEWRRATSYALDIFDDINNSVVGWLDWNMCLNEDGGPSWNGNRVDSTVIVVPEKGEFLKQPMFYVMGHFSKFVPRGSRRIHVTVNDEASSILNVAFITPHNTVVAVLYNEFPSTANIVLGDKQVSIQLEKNSITTVELPCHT